MFAALVLGFGSPASAQNGQPQCSDGIDNDADNAIDGTDAGCGGGSDNDETDSPYSDVTIITIPLPLVTLQGTVDARGTVKFRRVQVTARRGSTININCFGKSCPFKKSSRIVVENTLRLGQLERRKLRPPMSLTFRIQRPAQLGKFVKYTIRPRKAPVREDDCLDQTTKKRIPCFVG